MIRTEFDSEKELSDGIARVNMAAEEV